MKFRPLHDWTLIRPTDAKEKSSGGIFIPDSAQEKPQHGEVISVGKGRMKEERDKKGKKTGETYVKTVLKPGDRVFYEKYSVTAVEVESEELVMVREEDVLGYIQ